MPMSPRRQMNKVKFHNRVANEYNDGHGSFSSLNDGGVSVGDNNGSFSSLDLNGYSSSSLSYSPIPSSPHDTGGGGSARTATPSGKTKKIGKQTMTTMPPLDLLHQGLDCNSKHEKQYEATKNLTETSKSSCANVWSHESILKTPTTMVILLAILFLVCISALGTSLHLRLVEDVDVGFNQQATNIVNHNINSPRDESSRRMRTTSTAAESADVGSNGNSNNSNVVQFGSTSPPNKVTNLLSLRTRTKNDRDRNNDIRDTARPARLTRRSRDVENYQFQQNDERKHARAPALITAITTATTTTETTPSDVSELSSDNDNLVGTHDQAHGGEALAFIHGRRYAYKSQGLEKEWTLRGIGYLYSQKNIALHAHLPTGDESMGKIQQGHNIIRIVNVHPNRTTIQPQQNECDLLTIWVRVMGPEIFAGRANAVTNGTMPENEMGTGCHWEFSFDIQQMGNYTVDAKVVVWNGQATIGGNEHSECKVRKGLIEDREKFLEKYPKTVSFIGYKLHYPAKSCCEICSRTANCRYWSSPPSQILQMATIATTGCELYFDRDIDMNKVSLPPMSRLLTNITKLFDGGSDRRPDGSIKHDGQKPAKQYHGARSTHSNPSAYFVGCGWDNFFTLDFPCLSGDLDDRIYTTSGGSFTFSSSLPLIASAASPVKQQEEQENDKLPLCTIQDERLHVSNGRWARLDHSSSNSSSCPDKIEFDVRYGRSVKFDMTKFDGNNPQCWHRDDLSRIGNYCGEWNCRFLSSEAKWISALHQETNWNGIWKQYKCDYVELTDKEVQKCVSDRKILSIRTEGNSIAKFLNEYLMARLENITLYGGRGDDMNATNTSLAQPVDEGIDVVIDTLTLAALALNPDNNYFGVKKKLEKMAPITASSKREHYWVTGFFLSSEREPHVQARRMEHLNELAEEALELKGYRMINAFDMSAAFAYDTATQFDGLHLIGPSMKMIITKLFHHMCATHLQQTSDELVTE